MSKSLPTTNRGSYVAKTRDDLITLLKQCKKIKRTSDRNYHEIEDIVVDFGHKALNGLMYKVYGENAEYLGNKNQATWFLINLDCKQAIKDAKEEL